METNKSSHVYALELNFLLPYLLSCEEHSDYSEVLMLSDAINNCTLEWSQVGPMYRVVHGYISRYLSLGNIPMTDMMVGSNGLHNLQWGKNLIKRIIIQPLTLLLCWKSLCVQCLCHHEACSGWPMLLFSDCSNQEVATSWCRLP